MNHRPPGIPLGQLVAEMPVHAESCIFCTSTDCAQCNKWAWCLYVAVTPTPTSQAGLVPMCGRCLVQAGVGMATEQLRASGDGQPIIKSAPEIEIVEAE